MNTPEPEDRESQPGDLHVGYVSAFEWDADKQTMDAHYADLERRARSRAALGGFGFRPETKTAPHCAGPSIESTPGD